MTRVLETKVQISATKAQIFELLTSQDFSIEKAESTNSKVLDFIKTAETNTLKTTLVREFEREIPKLARNFIDERILAKEVFIWNSNQDEAQIKINIERAPIEIFGQLQLLDIAPGTSVEINLTIKSSVPFFNEKIEKFAENIWVGISTAELELVNRHFRQHF
ncbi:MAG: DUF2505 family protein [Candidatus Nanopelagicales bacterium]